ncbi:glycosyltransferase involved in cell wall biosynthesis [Thermonema lapsum]|uniref:Glycosyltransferase involved in cell wall biosynthesis n=1 Tax=Thermonema lapsum TaxID=28195 RepID=A0A846MST4_9BACT|nr:glycosyltransferase [Thermonema lapsum]NIK74656.1 glycosyltransferase involved in cell wall biosynthesis [Thermonema lapsum]
MSNQKTNAIKTTVLIPHYNNLDGLHKSLASIAAKPRVRVLIVDDGSKAEQRPDEAKLQNCFAHLQVIVLLNEKNRGIEHVLNQGLEYILEHFPDSPYIARLDAGDTCHPERFAIQERYMDEHPEVALLGSWVDIVTTEGKKIYTYKAPIAHEEIKRSMFLKIAFMHPSVLMRASAVRSIGGYPYDYPAAEDYAYFFKFVHAFKTAVIPQSLTFYELNNKGISMTKRKRQLRSRIKVLWANRALGNPYFWLGMLRVCMLFILPYSWVLFLKKKLNIQ